MDELHRLLNKVLADTFVLALKTQNLHWNVEDPDFYAYHKFTEGIYEELFDAVDPIAEHIRSVDGYAVGSLGQYLQMKSINEFVVLPPTMQAFAELLADHQKVVNDLMEAFHMAEKFMEHGLSNFLQDRMDAHKKHMWMLRATVKKAEEE
jgi:starvation-inducible DNA-binding protein